MEPITHSTVEGEVIHFEKGAVLPKADTHYWYVVGKINLIKTRNDCDNRRRGIDIYSNSDNTPGSKQSALLHMHKHNDLCQDFPHEFYPVQQASD